MNYISTRNKHNKKSASLAIIEGLASDGGLYIPENIPHFTIDQIRQMSELDYKKRAVQILSSFLTDYSKEQIEDCVNGAYCKDSFSDSQIAPLKKLDDKTFVLELWHGPTCAFKDMALQIMPRLLTCALGMHNVEKTIVILVATSGDTGKAALEGFCDVKGTKIMVFYPAQGVSEVQRRQMITQKGKNTSVVGVEGNFDHCQSGVKEIFSNADICARLTQNGFLFSSANSINWGRLLPQIVYYFSAYADMVKSGEISCGEKVDFVVPTGNFGDILAGFIAKEMGLCINKLICASNKNNILTDFIDTGIYDRNRDFYTTMSPSMDILISSNLERLLFLLSKGDDIKITNYMSQLASVGRYEVDDKILCGIKESFEAGFADESATLDTIKYVYDKYKYVIDPHTAVAFKVHNEIEGCAKRVILSTANPYKFPKSVTDALCEGAAVVADEFELFDLLSQKTGLMPPYPLNNARYATAVFNDVCSCAEMGDRVLEFLGIS